MELNSPRGAARSTYQAMSHPQRTLHVAAGQQEAFRARPKRKAIVEDDAESYQSSDDTAFPKEPFTEYDFPVDVWGMTMLVLVSDAADILNRDGKTYQKIRAIFTVFCALLNLALQAGILYFVDMFVVEGSVRNIQSDYRQFHKDAFSSDGTLNMTAFNELPNKDALCGAAINKTLFMTTILFLWASQILSEFRDTERLHRYVSCLPTAPSKSSHKDMVKGDFFDEDNANILVICLTRSVRFLIYALVLLPKLLIAVILTLLGCRWLISAENFGDLILNCLALHFVTDIDNILLENFFPFKARETLQRYKFGVCDAPDVDYGPVDPAESAEAYKERTKAEIIAAHERHIVQLYVKSVFFVISVVLFVYVYVQFWQTVIPGFRFDVRTPCLRDAAESSRSVPSCEAFDQTCFPYGDAGANQRRLSTDCPGGSLDGCTDMCPVDGELFGACFRSCRRRCEDAWVGQR